MDYPLREWRSAIDRFLFLALVYEVGLYFREPAGPVRVDAWHRTVFELSDYKLSREEFHDLIRELRTCSSDPSRRVALWLIEGMMRSRITWPLAWMTHYTPAVRQLLGLR